jgi:hypothetical protein
MMKSIDLLLFQVWGSQNYFFLGCRQASEMLVTYETIAAPKTDRYSVSYSDRYYQIIEGN